MKRLIRFHNIYASDKVTFSDCSTKYTILPYLFEDSASFDDIRKVAKELKIRLSKTNIQNEDRQSITQAIPLVGKMTKEEGYREGEKFQEYLGFFDLNTIRGNTLTPSVKVGKKITLAQANEIVDNMLYGVDSIGETVNGAIIVVKENWNYYHEMELLGYSLESFEKVLKITEHGFNDDTYRCDECGLFDRADDGYTYNFIDGLGKNCGCADVHLSSKDALEDHKDQSEKAMPLEIVKKHEKERRVAFIERFIGGLTDRGRGGSFGGKSVRNGSPDTVLEKLKFFFPKKEFIFSLDDSGQFQTYFSVWMVGASKKEAAKIQDRLSKIALE